MLWRGFTRHKGGEIYTYFGFGRVASIVECIERGYVTRGPAPPVHNELGDLANLPEKALARFCVKPGITGLAQVAGRNELAWPEKIRFDAEYVHRVRVEGLILDVQIALKTVWVLMNRKGVYDNKAKDQRISK